MRVVCVSRVYRFEYDSRRNEREIVLDQATCAAADDCQLEEMHECRGIDLKEARSLEWPSRVGKGGDQRTRKEVLFEEEEEEKKKKKRRRRWRSVVRLEYLPRRSCRDGLDGREQGRGGF